MRRLLKYGAPLLAGLGGVGAAYLWFNQSRLSALVPPIAFLLIGGAFDSAAQSALSKDQPEMAAKRIRGWVLAPVALAVLAAGAAIVIGVEWDPGEGASTQQKELAAAAIAAVGAFLVSAFIKNAEEADEKWIGGRFKKRFQARYNNRFRSGSPADRAVSSSASQGVEGWGESARERRASIVAVALREGKEVQQREAQD